MPIRGPYIAVITKWAGFRWVERKTLLSIDEVRLNVGKVAEEMRVISKKQDTLAARVEELLADRRDLNDAQQLAAHS